MQSIEAAKSDERVKGLYLNFTGSGMLSTGNMEELRNAIASFKESGNIEFSAEVLIGMQDISEKREHARKQRQIKRKSSKQKNTKNS